VSDGTRVPLDTPRLERRDATTIAGTRERRAFADFDFAVFPAQVHRIVV